MQRSRRLRKGTEFDTVYQNGTVVSGPLLILRYRANDGGETRWGFAVGKRLSKRATERNLVRRRLREGARTLPAHEGVDIVVTARTGALAASYADLVVALERALGRAGLLGGGGEC